MILLNQIPFYCGINNQILNTLKSSVQKMDEMSCHCILTFDEMSIEPGLSYSNKHDMVEGLVDCGDGKKLQFSDHVMVFMVRGIARK